MTKDIISTIAAFCFCLFILIIPGNYILTISVLSIIYFLSDMCFQKLGWIFIIHHVLSICGFIFLMFTKNQHAIYLFLDSLKALELSNLTLYINYLLIYSNNKNWNNTNYRWFFTVHVINYIFWRVFYFGFNIFNNIDTINTNIPLKLSSFLFIGGLYWSILLLLKCKRNNII